LSILDNIRAMLYGAGCHAALINIHQLAPISKGKALRAGNIDI